MAQGDEYETEAQRSERAAKILEERVRRETIVDTRLDGHDRRLAAINGQLERGAKATETVAERLSQLDHSVSDLRAEIVTKRAVDDALRSTAAEAVKKQVTRREFWMGVLVVIVAILSVAVNAGII